LFSEFWLNIDISTNITTINIETEHFFNLGMYFVIHGSSIFFEMIFKASKKDNKSLKGKKYIRTSIIYR